MSNNCLRNNRLKVFEPFEREDVVERHPVMKNGKRVWVEGPALDPYEKIPASSITLKSRIDSGVFENHEGRPRSLEKANASDMISDVVDSAIKETSDYNERQEKRKAFREMQERGRKILADVRKRNDNKD